MPSSNCLLVIAVTQKAKGSFCMTAILLFHILQKRYLKKSRIFLNYLLPSSLQDPILSYTTPAPTSHASVTWLLIIVGNKKV